MELKTWKHNINGCLAAALAAVAWPLERSTKEKR